MARQQSAPSAEDVPSPAFGQQDDRAFLATGATFSAHPEFEQLQLALARQRRADLTAEEENRRQQARNMLRHGKFKPTGRSKPASEYLLGVVRAESRLPVVLPAVDVANFISVKHLIPISIWDTDAAGGSDFVFRVGAPDEKYVFNAAGHVIDLEDLVCGCVVADHISSYRNHHAGPEGTPKDSEVRREAGGGDNAVVGIPIVNPVKDSMQTKLAPTSEHIAAVAYVPGNVFGRSEIAQVVEDFRELFRLAGFRTTGTAVLAKGESVAL